MAHDPDGLFHAGQQLAENRVRQMAEAAGIRITGVRWEDFGPLVVLQVSSSAAKVDRRVARAWLEDLSGGTTRATLELVFRDVVRKLTA